MGHLTDGTQLGTLVFETADILGAGGWWTRAAKALDGTFVSGSDAQGPAYRDYGSDRWVPILRVGENYPVDAATLLIAGNNTYDIDVCRTNSDIMWWIMGNNLWKTTDRTQTIERVTAFGTHVAPANGPNRMTGDPIAIDPNNGAVVFCGVESIGLRYTLDGGASFTTVDTGTIPIPVNLSRKAYLNITVPITSGQTITGMNSGATAIVFGDYAVSSVLGNSIYFHTITGTFQASEGFSVGGVQVGTFNGSTFAYAPMRYCVAYDPTSAVVGGKTQGIYCGVNGYGIYRSTNGGTSWALIPGSPTYFSHIVISEHDGSLHCAGFPINETPAQYRRWDGTSWIAPTGISGKVPVISPHNEGHMYLLNGGSYFRVSLDNGTNWSSQNNNRRTADRMWWHQWCNENYMSNGYGLINDIDNELWNFSGIGTFKITNPPTSISFNELIYWTEQSVGLENLVTGLLNIDENGRLLVGCHDRRAYIVDHDKIGRCFPPEHAGFPGPTSIIHGMDVDYDPVNPDFLVAPLFSYPGIYSENGGKSWTDIPGDVGDFSGTGAGGGNVLVFDEDTWVIREVNHGKIMRTTDKGVTWTDVGPNGGGAKIGSISYNINQRCLIKDPKAPTTTAFLYLPSSVAGDRGVWRTTDKGATWTRVYSNYIISAGDLFTSRFTWMGGTTWLMSGGNDVVGLKISTDDMATWNTLVATDDVHGAAGFSEIYSLASGPPLVEGGDRTVACWGFRHVTPTAAVTTYGGLGLWFSDDAGATFKHTAVYPGGIFQTPQDMIADPVEPGSFYIALGSGGVSKVRHLHRVRAKDVTPSTDSDIILAILTGQSNMPGRVANDGANVNRANKKQFDCVASSPTYRQILDDTLVLKHPENLDRTGPDDQILDDLAVAYPDKIIIGVPAGWGGQGYFPTFTFYGAATSGASGSNFNAMVDNTIAAVTAIQAAYPGAVIEPRMYIQNGENEAQASRTRADVTTHLSGFITHARDRMAAGTSLAAFSDMPTTLGLMVLEQWYPSVAGGNDAWRTVVAGMVDVHLALDNVYMVAKHLTGTVNNDVLHHSTPRVLGSAHVIAAARTDVPAITTSATQSNVLNTALDIQLAYLNDQTDANNLCTFHIVGGANQAEFEIDNAYVASNDRPTLRWSGADTGPASEGDYVVQIALRNSAGYQGPTLTITVDVAAPAVLPWNVTQTGLAGPQTTGVSEITFTNIPVHTGRNLFYFHVNGGGTNFDALTPVMQRDGVTMTKVAGVATGANQQLWEYIHAGANTTATIRMDWAAGGGGQTNCYLLSAVVDGTTGTATATASTAYASTAITMPYTTGSITVPAGGGAVLMGVFGHADITAAAGTLTYERNSTPNFFIMERETTGALSWNSINGSQARGWIVAAYDNP